MRHLKYGKKLNRTRSHLKSMLRNMIVSLINFEMIKTTSTKAKLLKKTIEPIISISKQDNHHNRIILFSILRSKEAIIKLFNILGPRLKNENGGYTKIIKYNYRRNDGAMMSYIMFKDFYFKFS
ncbi:50S ribosomal protein L17 [Candidatus Annandia pinicola]|uniref:50S ribosomal protein L17 n=1 Tax=Candidatus Annandia pinicola TaxID=1345117 RepID=UPI001D02E55B|nr:50S ribosomal protein L17 [Candidatus Annandia pinicola]UDG80475.1 50S ribosomal protein L17 [Candidatus Annandia pinicola]